MLVIGIGNPLRGDDGVGWLLAEEALAGETLAEPASGRVRAVHQLTPELAPELAEVDRVLFVDAWQGAAADAEPLLGPVVLTPACSSGSHLLAPADLLAITLALFDASPQADQLLVPAFAFAHGTNLSEKLRTHLPAARRLLRHWTSLVPPERCRNA